MKNRDGKKRKEPNSLILTCTKRLSLSFLPLVQSAAYKPKEHFILIEPDMYQNLN